MCLCEKSQNKKAPVCGALQKGNRKCVRLGKVSLIYISCFLMFAYVLCIYKVYTQIKISEKSIFVTKINNK